MRKRLSEITPEIIKLSELCTRHGKIDSSLKTEEIIRLALKSLAKF